VRGMLSVATFVVPLLAFQAGAAWGATFDVVDAAELEAALLEAASNGEDDTIRVRQGTYTGNFVYDSSEGHSIEVLGGYYSVFWQRDLDPSNTVFDAAGSGRPLFLINSEGGDINVEGFTFQNGSANIGGGLYAESYSETGTAGDIDISSNIVKGNENPVPCLGGGGVFAYSTSDSGTGGDVTLTGNTITGNTALGIGGGVLARSNANSGTAGKVALRDNSISQNTATVSGGAASVASYASGTNPAGDIELTNNEILNNDGGNAGGGVYAESGVGWMPGGGQAGNLTFTGNTIADNTAGWGGGVSAISYSDSGPTGNVTFIGNVVTRNTTTADEGVGGGVDARSTTDGAATTGNLVFHSASGRGGGVYARGYAAVGGEAADIVLSGNDISDNTTTGDICGAGGVQALLWGGTRAGDIHVTDNTINGNFCEGVGGIDAESYANPGPDSGEIVFTGNTLSDNQTGVAAYLHSWTYSSSGGGRAGGPIVVSGNTISGNPSGVWATGDFVIADGNLAEGNGPAGGGIYAGGEYGVEFTNNTIRGNTAQGGYGGGATIKGSELTVAGNVITGNTLVGRGHPSVRDGGGGLYVTSVSAGATTFTFTNNVIAGNLAEGAVGGGVYGYLGHGDLIFNSNTIFGNTASVGTGTGFQPGIGGGIHFWNVEVADIFNNIVWGNEAEGTDPYEETDDIYMGASTIYLDNNDFSEISPGWVAGSPGNIDVDPLFVDTSDPDPSNWDLHLSAASPAIDAGTFVGAPDNDFEGDVRPQGYDYDIGADEFIEDGDGDGIADEVDTLPDQFSNQFEDSTGTYGRILDRGDQELAITDALDPDGVRVTANALGGTDPATVRFCGGSYTADLWPGNFVVRGCSFEIDVIRGRADLTLLASDGTPATTSLETGNGLTFDPGAFSITAAPTNTEPVVMAVGGDEISVAPGESALLSDACDVDRDGDVDLYDTEAIFDARGTAASGPDDPMDANGDGIITVNDGRICVLECDLENCEEPAPAAGPTAAPASCGLIGIEPFLLLGLPLWARRRRGGAR